MYSLVHILQLKIMGWIGSDRLHPDRNKRKILDRYPLCGQKMTGQESRSKHFNGVFKGGSSIICVPDGGIHTLLMMRS